MSEPNIWIARRWVDGKTPSGRDRRRTEKVVGGIRSVKTNDIILVMWSVGRSNGEKKMRSLGKEGYREAEVIRAEKRKELFDDARPGNLKRTAWKEFRKLFERERLQTDGAERKSVHTIRDYREIFDLIEEKISPRWIESLDEDAVRKLRTHLVNDKVEKRTKGDHFKPPTINKKLRYLRAVLRFAAKRKFKVETEVELVKENPNPNPISNEHFKLVMENCDDAPWPCSYVEADADYWRAFLWLLRSTGARLDEVLSLPWDCVSLDEGYYLLPNQKNGEASVVPIGEKTIEYLRKIQDVHSLVFPIDRHRSRLDAIFKQRIQKKAGIHLRCIDALRDKTHRCTDSCHLYSCHDLRAGMATDLAQTVPKIVLQSVARHNSSATTEKYYVNKDVIRKKAGPIGEPDFC